MEFRPCIDIHNGKVKQIVGGSLRDEGNQAGEVTNEQRFISRYFAQVLARWHDEAYRNVSTEIEPLRYINSTTSNNTEDAQ